MGRHVVSDRSQCTAQSPLARGLAGGQHRLADAGCIKTGLARHDPGALHHHDIDARLLERAPAHQGKERHFHQVSTRAPVTHRVGQRRGVRKVAEVLLFDGAHEALRKTCGQAVNDGNHLVSLRIDGCAS